MSAGTQPQADAASSPGGDDPDALRLRISGERVSDVEVAAVSVAVAALLGAGGPREEPTAAPAWRRAGMLEAATARRVRSPGELRSSQAR